MEAIKIVAIWLKDNGYDGLYTDGCGCEISDLMPCGEFGSQCMAGYKVPCLDDENNEPRDWHIGGIKNLKAKEK